jgi:hypothetical protein
VENRQPIEYDRKIPAGTDGKVGGLAIWHIDLQKEISGNGEANGAPGQTKFGLPWPKNGVHFIQALLTPVGDFAGEMIQTPSTGDWLWRDTNKGTVGLSAAGLEGFEYPNTNGYQHGIITQSFAKIYNIKRAVYQTWQFDFVKEAGPAGSCANVDCNQANKGGICRNFNGAAATCDCNWGWVC